MKKPRGLKFRLTLVVTLDSGGDVTVNLRGLLHRNTRPDEGPWRVSVFNQDGVTMVCHVAVEGPTFDWARTVERHVVGHRLVLLADGRVVRTKLRDAYAQLKQADVVVKSASTNLTPEEQAMI
jgi:hypothetical protein